MSGIVCVNHTYWSKATVVDLHSSQSTQHKLTNISLISEYQNLQTIILLEFNGTRQTYITITFCN